MPTILDRLRFTPAALALQHKLARWKRARRHANSKRTTGHCPICDSAATFAETDVDNPRESPVCLGCGSVPRQRALIRVLTNELAATLHESRLHESSPSLATFRYFIDRCPMYAPSYFWPEVEPGRSIGPFRCVDLHDQPFSDQAFDLVVTLDVLEHVQDPLQALREIRRTLAPGGMHVFTVPRTPGIATRTRARRVQDSWQHDLPPEYHRDPVARSGALVVTDWGDDLESRIESTGPTCEARSVIAPEFGIATAVEVFVATRVD